jgi:hypothetical protein
VAHYPVTADDAQGHVNCEGDSLALLFFILSALIVWLVKDNGRIVKDAKERERLAEEARKRIGE